MREPFVANHQILQVLRELFPGLPKRLRKLQLTLGMNALPVLEVEELVDEVTQGVAMTVVHTKIFDLNFVGEKPPMVIPPGGTTTDFEDRAERRSA